MSQLVHDGTKELERGAFPSEVVDDQRLRVAKHLGARVLDHRAELRAQVLHTLGGHGTDRGHDGSHLEVRAEHAPDGVVDGAREIEVERRIAVDEKDPVIAEEPELDAAELRRAIRRRPVDGIGEPVSVPIREAGVRNPVAIDVASPASGIEGRFVVEVPHAVPVEVDVSLAKLPEEVADREVGDRVSVGVAEGESLEFFVVSEEPIDPVERRGVVIAAGPPVGDDLARVRPRDGRRPRGEDPLERRALPRTQDDRVGDPRAKDLDDARAVGLTLLRRQARRAQRDRHDGCENPDEKNAKRGVVNRPGAHNPHRRRSSSTVVESSALCPNAAWPTGSSPTQRLSADSLAGWNRTSQLRRGSS